jgi:hypothetical protein
MALGVMTAIGGFVDIGNLVASGLTRARFGMSLAWALMFGALGMVLFGEMVGRMVAVTRRPFHVVRERLGVRAALVNPGRRPGTHPAHPRRPRSGPTVPGGLVTQNRAPGMDERRAE